MATPDGRDVVVFGLDGTAIMVGPQRARSADAIYLSYQGMPEADGHKAWASKWDAAAASLVSPAARLFALALLCLVIYVNFNLLLLLCLRIYVRRTQPIRI
jgi:hypothetical protein